MAAADTEKNKQIIAVLAGLAIVGGFYLGMNKWGISMLGIPPKQ